MKNFIANDNDEERINKFLAQIKKKFVDVVRIKIDKIFDPERWPEYKEGYKDYNNFVDEECEKDRANFDEMCKKKEVEVFNVFDEIRRNPSKELPIANEGERINDVQMQKWRQEVEPQLDDIINKFIPKLYKDLGDSMKNIIANAKNKDEIDKALSEAKNMFENAVMKKVDYDILFPGKLPPPDGKNKAYDDFVEEEFEYVRAEFDEKFKGKRVEAYGYLDKACKEASQERLNRQMGDMQNWRNSVSGTFKRGNGGFFGTPPSLN